jgi:hypothetical protein
MFNPLLRHVIYFVHAILLPEADEGFCHGVKEFGKIAG